MTLTINDTTMTSDQNAHTARFSHHRNGRDTQPSHAPACQTGLLRQAVRRGAFMGLAIGDDAISSDRSAHTARLAPGQEQLWEVSWLPGRRVDRNSAITPTVHPDVTGPGDVREGHRLRTQAEAWASELGLTAPDVLTGTASPPDHARAGKNAVPADSGAGG